MPTADTPTNRLVTGPPRSGKTTTLERVRDGVSGTAGGLLAPEVRVDGDRVGFDLVDLRGGRVQMARVARENGPGVGKYRVDVPAVDDLAGRALERAGVDYWVVDEIAPMEVHSDQFVRGVRAILDGDTPVVAAVHAEAGGFPAAVRERADATLFDLGTPDTTVESVVDSVAGRLTAVTGRPPDETDDDGPG